jgi:RimJ/RimL family protein N-acetyltransferase
MLPTIKTKRLILNPFHEDDVQDVVNLAGDKNVYKTTLNLPHPYKTIDAQRWIASHSSSFIENKAITFAIRLNNNCLIGAISLAMDSKHSRGELGYWIGTKYWNNGYCTEAVKAVIAHAFTTMNMNKVYARHLSKNVASGIVMEKCGMIKEGCQREQYLKSGKYVDIIEHGILKSDYNILNKSSKTPRRH